MLPYGDTSLLIYITIALTSPQASSLGVGSALLESAILASPMVTIQAEVTTVTVPVAMVTDLFAMETGAFCSELPSFDHVTRDPCDRPW